MPDPNDEAQTASQQALSHQHSNDCGHTGTAQPQGKAR